MTKCIAIETSTTKFSLASYNNGVICEYNEIDSKNHAKNIYININNIINQSKMNINELDFIALGNGPGRFSGLRVSASAIQAITYVRKIPIVSVSSLMAIAQVAIDNYSLDKIAVAMTARKGKIYFGCYKKGEDSLAEEVIKDCLIDADSFHFSDGSFYGVGNGYSQEIMSKKNNAIKLINNHETVFPDAKTMIKNAIKKYELGIISNSFNIIPNYLMDEVAN
ncbi:MAG: tRNA (adenosine(37)-N6)-threonylcarbamoyltransferase complex dimerization subunit type 1 TsaB [Gammaproteobacteria bacterium]|jgi:tRNA threonylcarbamoyladenosine biosynthesis protein TsaB|nr:tRNA (adenosine(37)-N6)-threonylcarbamoyltransferase complex dimerization subunit type 1 TsaB [Gammaproteobacteria bacterium]